MRWKLLITVYRNFVSPNIAVVVSAVNLWFSFMDDFPAWFSSGVWVCVCVCGCVCGWAGCRRQDDSQQGRDQNILMPERPLIITAMVMMIFLWFGPRKAATYQYFCVSNAQRITVADHVTIAWLQNIWKSNKSNKYAKSSISHQVDQNNSFQAKLVRWGN